MANTFPFKLVDSSKFIMSSLYCRFVATLPHFFVGNHLEDRSRLYLKESLSVFFHGLFLEYAVSIFAAVVETGA